MKNNQLTLYVIERSNPDCNPDPEVVLDGKQAFYKVQKEYEDQCAEFGIRFNGNEDDPESACVEIDFDLSFEDHTGKAYVDNAPAGDRWEWRVTKHRVCVPVKGVSA